ncbi:MAG: AI-2E family transporter [Chloroflexi bacterium]|nr:AI-2E family transporter [Chloroflexota bacterium]
MPPLPNNWSWLRIGALAGGLYLLYLVRGILPPFVVAGMLAYLLAPLVAWSQRHLRLSRGPAVMLVVLLIVGPPVAVLVLLAPLLFAETRALVTRGPELLAGIVVQLLGGTEVELLGQTVSAAAISDQLLGWLIAALDTPSGAVHLATLAVEALLGVFVTFVVLLYVLLDPSQIGRFALDLFPVAERPRVRRIGAEVHTVLGRYLGGLLLLIALMAGVTWLGLTLLFRLPYALPLALLTGVLEIIPIIGPLLAGTLAAGVALTHGGVQVALWVVLMYFVLRQLEDQIVVPLVFSRTVELHPAVTIFSVLTGGALAGILGLLLAVPVVVIVKVVRESVIREA